MPMTTPDEGVREIQLSGKQLVFLFMAVTVVSVVIFLCGVLVGRGVQARAALVDAPAMADTEPVDDAGAPPAEPAPDSPTPRADVSFPQRLEKNETPAEKLVPRKDPPAQGSDAGGGGGVTRPRRDAADGDTDTGTDTGCRGARGQGRPGAAVARHSDASRRGRASPSRWRRSVPAARRRRSSSA